MTSNIANVRRVLIAGAGTMGSGIAQVVAEAGMEALLFDVDRPSLERGLTAIDRRWDRAMTSGRRAIEEVAAFRNLLSAGDLSATSEVDLIVEAIVENFDAKAQLWSELGGHASPDALLASNTSSISITALGKASGHAQRFVGMHFFNPVPAMALVEIVRGLDTADSAVERAVAFTRWIGKTPVVVNDAPGFVANRILLPMINEAISAVQDNVAAPEAVDEVMRLGMAHPMGPLALADLIGLDVCLDILETLHHDFGDDKYRPAPLLRRMVAGGKLGRKTGQGFYRYDLQ